MAPKLQRGYYKCGHGQERQRWADMNEKDYTVKQMRQIVQEMQQKVFLIFYSISSDGL